MTEMGDHVLFVGVPLILLVILEITVQISILRVLQKMEIQNPSKEILKRHKRAFRVWGRRMGNRIRNGLLLGLDTVLTPLLISVSRMIPVRRGLILFMGRQVSGFLDNNKYLLIYLKQRGYLGKYDIWYMGHADKVVLTLSAMGFKAENYFSLKTYWLLMRAQLIITDNAHWTTHNRSNVAGKAKKVQMWHGIGFKKIRLSDEDFVAKSKGIKGFLRYKLQGRLQIYDLFVSTSDYFSDNIFIPSFKPKEIVNLGYCRNDILFEDFSFEQKLVEINMDRTAFNRVLTLKKQGNKIILYAPTFRNARSYHVEKGEIDFGALDEFGEKNGITFLFKLHPLLTNRVDLSSYKNIVEYSGKCDVYPLFKYTDMLITDYSSIYLDYLLLDKPCAFFMYDFEYYTGQCRGIRSDFETLLPGRKCYTQAELYQVISDTLINGKDEYADERKRIRDMAWDYQDGHSCERVWNYIENKYLK